jgi:hypothetical protein
MGAVALRGQRQEEDPCLDALLAYERCAAANAGRAPREYEGEYCEPEKQVYLACRRGWARGELKGQRAEKKEAAERVG